MTWDESKHPREPRGIPEGGQFIDKDSVREWNEIEAFRAARRGAELPSDPAEAKRFETYREFQEETQRRAEELGDEKLQYEMAYGVWDDGASSEMGEYTLNGMGVKFTDAELRELEGAYIVHNHPNESGLSSADLKLAAENGLKGIVATTQDGMWRAELNTELISGNPEYYGQLLENLHKKASSDADFIAQSRITNDGWTAEEGIKYRAKETAEVLNNWEKSKELITIRFSHWEMPEAYKPGGGK